MSGKIEMADVVRALEKVRGAPVLTSNQCWDLAQALNAAAPVVERQDLLPCDVRVAPATTIKKGCKIETLMQCIESRKGQPDKFTRFKNSAPPAPVAVPVEIHQQLIEMRQQFERANFVALGKLLTACLDKVKELNQ